MKPNIFKWNCCFDPPPLPNNKHFDTMNSTNFSTKSSHPYQFQQANTHTLTHAHKCYWFIYTFHSCFIYLTSSKENIAKWKVWNGHSHCNKNETNDKNNITAIITKMVKKHLTSENVSWFFFLCFWQNERMNEWMNEQQFHSI